MEKENIEAIQEWLIEEDKSSKIHIAIGIDLLTDLSRNKNLITAANRFKHNHDKVLEFLEYNLKKLLPEVVSEEVPSKEPNEDSGETATGPAVDVPGVKTPMPDLDTEQFPEKLKEQYQSIRPKYQELVVLHAQLKDAPTNEACKEIVGKMIEAEDAVKEFWKVYDNWKAGIIKVETEKIQGLSKNFEGKSLQELSEMVKDLKNKTRNKQNTINRAVKDSEALKGAKKANKLEDVQRHQDELKALCDEIEAIELEIEKLITQTPE